MKLSAPVVPFLAVLLSWSAATALIVALAWRGPWLGVTLASDESGIELRSADPGGPGRALPVPARLLSVGGVELQQTDLSQGPDLLGAGMTAFFERQQRLSGALEAPTVAVVVQPEGGPARALALAPRPARPLRALPAAFWLMLVVGSGGLLLSGWVWALRPREWGTRVFGFTGLALFVNAAPAAVFVSRELALPEGLSRWLTTLNALGAEGYGVAMIALFLVYPRALVRPRTLGAIGAAFPALFLLERQVLVPAGWIGSRSSVPLLMLVLAGAIAWQWWASRPDLLARSALNSLGLAVVLSLGVYAAVFTGPLFVPGARVPHAYSFVSFLFFHAALAVGLRRYRLFELDGWAFRLLFYGLGALLLVAVDLGLVLLLRLAPPVAMSVAFLVIGFAYLPLREALWRRLVLRRTIPEHELFHAVIAVAFGATEQGRAAEWTALQQRLFQPLELIPGQAGSEPELRAEGLELVIPSIASAPALTLRYPWGGRGLFGPGQLQLARQLLGLMRHAEASRTAYERGVAEERRRIGRDLHDDVGARLLSGLHQPDLARTRQTVRDALADVRTIVRGLSSEHPPLGQVLRELRHETAERLEGAGLALDWPIGPAEEAAQPLPYPVAKNLGSALREVVSNTLRHAGATRVRVRTAWKGAGSVAIELEDDGQGMTRPPPGQDGHGLRNVVERFEAIGGSAEQVPSERGVHWSLLLPLPPGRGEEEVRG